MTVNALVGLFALLVSTGVADDVAGLRALTTWDVTEAKWPSQPIQSCGLRDLQNYSRTRFDHQIGSDVDDKRATRQIALLDGRVTRFLKQHNWQPIDMGPSTGGIPDLSRCFQKEGTTIQIYQTTGRCTMNTPCTAFDGFAITIYQRRAR